MSCERCNAMHRRAQRAEAGLHALWKANARHYRRLSFSGGSFGRALLHSRVEATENALRTTIVGLEQIAERGDPMSRGIARQLLDHLPEPLDLGSKP